MTRRTRRSGAMSWGTVLDMPNEATVAPIEMRCPH
jgi:hypothetical protein